MDVKHGCCYWSWSKRLIECHVLYFGNSWGDLDTHRILKLLHQDIKVKFEANGIEKVIKSTIGGKQSDLRFPSLFNLHIFCTMMRVSWTALEFSGCSYGNER